MNLMKSWVKSANSADTQFPLNNLPYGVFSTDENEPRCGVAIGDMIVDVTTLEAEGILQAAEQDVFDVPFWNDFMEEGPAVWASFQVSPPSKDSANFCPFLAR